MRRTGHLWLIALIVLSGTADTAAQQAMPMVTKMDVSQTALWVGDPLVYTIEIACPPGTDILVDDISRDRLRLTGLEIIEARREREARPDGTVVHRAIFGLTSYVIDGSPVRIEAQPVRYYVQTAGRRLEALVPSSELQLPAIDVAVRSTIPDGGSLAIRDVRSIASLPSGLRFMTPLGIAAVVLTAAPVVVGLAGTVARIRKPQRLRRWRRRRSRRHRETLDQIRALDVWADAAVRLAAVDRLNALLRDYLGDLDVPAQALTVEEIEREFAKRTKRLRADDVAAVLRQCERARYGGPDQLPGPEAVTEALEKTAGFLSVRV